MDLCIDSTSETGPRRMSTDVKIEHVCHELTTKFHASFMDRSPVHVYWTYEVNGSTNEATDVSFESRLMVCAVSVATDPI